MEFLKSIISDLHDRQNKECMIISALYLKASCINTINVIKNMRRFIDYDFHEISTNSDDYSNTINDIIYDASIYMKEFPEDDEVDSKITNFIIIADSIYNELELKVKRGLTLQAESLTRNIDAFIAMIGVNNKHDLDDNVKDDLDFIIHFMDNLLINDPPTFDNLNDLIGARVGLSNISMNIPVNW